MAVAGALIAAVACPWLGGCRPTEVKVSETPIRIVEETVGRGRAAEAGDVVCIAYRVTLPDGTELLKDDEFCFTLGAGAVIAGFDETIPGMRRGGRRVADCPPHKHWGRIGYGKGGKQIPRNTHLMLDVRLTSIQ